MRDLQNIWPHLQTLLSLCAALVAVSAQLVPLSQNSASTASEHLHSGHYNNRKSYAVDESKIRKHTVTGANNAEGSRDVTGAISDPTSLPPIEPIYPYYSIPAEFPYSFYSAPAEVTYPFYGLPLEYANPYYSVPAASYFQIPYAAYDDFLYPYYTVPTPGYYGYQQRVPYIASPLNPRGSLIAEPLLNPGSEIQPAEFVDPTLLRAFYPEFPVHAHYSVTNNFKGVSAAANPISAGAEIVSDNTAYSKDIGLLQGHPHLKQLL
jgi:hypothetical protein